MVMQAPAAVCINSKNVFVCFDFDGKSVVLESELLYS